MVSRPDVTTRLAVFATFVVVVGTALASCSDAGSDDTDATASTTTSTIVATVPSDGHLTIGVMRPPSASLLRESLSVATERAVAKINEAGGSFGGTVTLEIANEGETVTSAREAIEELLSKHVDAIIGPTSSVNALSVLDSITSAGVLACSPTASALALDDFPDDDLFFRTVPSDSMQAAAIVEEAEQTGVRSVTVVYVDDAYGRPFATAVKNGLASLSIEVAASVPFASGDSELEDEIDTVLESDPEVVILLANSNDSTQFLEALSEADSSSITMVIANDALRSADSAQRLANLRPSLRETITGVAPQAEADDPTAAFDPPGPFATNAFDCVTLIALAAQLAQSDVAADIANGMSAISNGGSQCVTYQDCVDELDRGREIDYNGPSGITDIGASTGAPTRARFDVFAIDESGNDTVVDHVVVGG